MAHMDAGPSRGVLSNGQCGEIGVRGSGGPGYPRRSGMDSGSSVQDSGYVALRMLRI